MSDPEIRACLEQISSARESLGLALADLKKQRVLNPLDYREWVRKHPVESVVGAAVAGFVLAGPAGSGRGDGKASLLDEFTRAGFDTALHVFLKTLL